MAIDFPASPTNGQTFTSGSVTYTWDGTKWTAVAAAGSSNSISQGNTNATVTDTGSDGRFVVTTEGSERLRVDSSGRLGIGNNSPQAIVHATTAGAGQIRHSDGTRTIAFGSTGSETFVGSGANLTFLTNGLTSSEEKARIDTSGRLLVGTSSARTVSYWDTPQVQIEGLDYQKSSLCIYNNQDVIFGSVLELGHSRGTSIGSNAALQNNDYLGTIAFYGSDGSNEIRGAEISTFVDGTPGANDMPGRLVFSTTADGASSPTERARITAKGHLLVGKTAEESMSTAGFETRGAGGAVGMTSATVNGDWCFAVNRLSSDGDLILLRQDTVTEGSISVSGTTVSYNGAHLSRWSQLPGGAERTEILRGTVLSNIDEMCEWGDEDNEQLNRMKVSDVEGDKNVAGVFQAWDDGDDTYTNDFYCAMTGDFIIRIGAGVTVERGDLLMSAGDGTAKPQDDDIIRSKTIAKVISTNVSCTYDDGSYCVPCVLMAC